MRRSEKNGSSAAALGVPALLLISLLTQRGHAFTCGTHTTKKVPQALHAKKKVIGLYRKGRESDWSFGDSFPYTEEDFRRADESTDTEFYQVSRFVRHIDQNAIHALTAHYREILKPGDDVLDLCSSWISHLPEEIELGRVFAMGLNAEELAANTRANGNFLVRDLNTEPDLPFPDDSFDKVFMVVSVDYLTMPQQIFKEIFRVLKPDGGIACISFSNRCFPTKAIQRWLLDSDTSSRVQIVANYFYFSAPWSEIAAYDLINESFTFNVFLNLLSGSSGDPMLVVQGYKNEIN